MISIIIPVYNVEKYLEKCVDSVLSQTYQDFELILVDDGSTDTSGIICDKYQKVDSRVTVLHKKNGGVSSARNAGLKIASGEYISFVDSDDWLAHDFLETAYRECTKYNLDLYMCGFARVKSDETLIQQIFLESNIEIMDRRMSDIEKKVLLDLNYISGPWGKFYRRELFTNIKFDETMCFGEDTVFVYQCINLASRILASSCIGYYYRNLPTSLVSTITVNKCRSMPKLYHFLYENLQNDFGAENVEYGFFLKERICEDYRQVVSEIMASKYGVIKKYIMLNILFSDSKMNELILMMNNRRGDFRPVRIIGKYYHKKMKKLFRKIKSV